MANLDQFNILIGADIDEKQVQEKVKDAIKAIESNKNINKIDLKFDFNNQNAKKIAQQIEKSLKTELNKTFGRGHGIKINWDQNISLEGIDDLGKKIQTTANNLKNLRLDEASEKFIVLKNTINQVKDAYEDLNNITDDLEYMSAVEDIRQKLNALDVELNDINGTKRADAEETRKQTKSINDYVNALAKLHDTQLKIKQAESDMKSGKYNEEEMRKYISSLKDVEGAQQRDVEQKRQVAQELTNVNRVEAASEIEMKKYASSVDAINVKESQRLTFLQQLQGGFKSAISALTPAALAFQAVNAAIQQLRQSVDIIKELDKVLVDLQIVTGNTREQTHDMLLTYNQMAKDMGRTTSVVANAANEYLRMGFSAEESNELIKQSLTLSTLGMIDSAEATDYMISAMKGYGVAVKDVSKIIDMATELDMKYSVSSGYIMEAMSRTAASAKLAGSDMSQLMATISIVGETTKKSAQVVGEAMKTMYARFGNVKINKFEDAEHPEEVEGINDIERVLNKLGIALRDNTGAWRDYDDVMGEVGKRFNELNDLEQNAIATAMFGTRQRENGIVILTNWNRVLEANEVALNASGTAEKRMEAYNQGLEASLNKLKAEWEKFLLSLHSNTVLKGLVDILTQLVGLLNNGFVRGIIVLQGIKFVLPYFSKLSVAFVTLLGNMWAMIKGIPSFVSGVASGSVTLNSLTASGMTAAGAITALQAALGGIALIFGVVSLGINYYNKQQDELRSKAIDSIDTLKEENEELENIKKEISDLRKTYDDSNSSITDSYLARQRLIEIEDTLVTKYGMEKGAIDTVTDSISEQIKKIDELDSKRALKSWGEIETAYHNAENWLNGTPLIAGRISAKFSNDQVRKDVLQMAEESGFKSVWSTDGTQFNNTAKSRNEQIDNLQKLKDELIEYQSIHRELLNDDNFAKHLSDIDNALKIAIGDQDKYNERLRIIKEGTELQVKSSYTNELSEVQDAEDKYREAKLSGDKKTIDESYNYLIQKAEEAAVKAEKEGNKAVAGYFRDIAKEYVKTNKDIFKELITTGDQKWLGEAIEKGLNTDTMVEKLAKLQDEYKLTKEEVEQVVNEIKNIGEESDKAADDALNLSSALGTMSDTLDKINGLGDIMDSLASGNELTKSQLDELIKEYPELSLELTKYLSGLIDEQELYQILKNKQNGLYDKYKEELRNAYTSTTDFKTNVYNTNKTLFAQLGVEYDANAARFKISNMKMAADAITYSGKAQAAWLEAMNSFLDLPWMSDETKGQDSIYLDKEGNLWHHKDNPNVGQPGEYHQETNLGKSAAAIRKNSDTAAKELTDAAAKLASDVLGGGSGTGTGSTSSTSSSEDKWKKQFDSFYNDLKHQLDMDYIVEKDYYDRLEELNNKYFANRKDYEEEYKKYLEEVYKGRKNLWTQAYNDELKELKRQLDKKLINDQQYLEAYRKLVDRYYGYNNEFEGKTGASPNGQLYSDLFKDQFLSGSDEIYKLETQEIESEYENWLQLHENYIDEMDYYNKWSLQQKLSYLAEEQAMMEKIYGQNTAIAEKFANEQEQLARKIYDTAKSIAEQDLDVHEAYLDYVNNIIDDRIKSLQEDREELEKDNKERERAIQLAELEKKLAEAKRNKVLIYRKGQGFVYEEDQTAVNAAQKDIDDYTAEVEKEKRLDAIDEEIKSWEEYKNKWNETVNAYNKEQTRLTALMYEGYADEKSILQQKTDLIDKYAESYAKAAMKVAQSQQMINSGIYDMKYNSDSESFTSTQKGNQYTASGNLASEVRQAQSMIGNSGQTWAILPNGQSVAVNVNSSNKVTDSVPIGSTIVNKSGAWTITGGEAGNYQAKAVDMSSGSSSGGGSSSSSSKSSSSSSKSSSSGSSSSKETISKVAKSVINSSSLPSVVKNAAKSVVSKVLGYASGTEGTTDDNIALVGEEGAELRLLPKGSGVVPNPETQTLMKFAQNPASFINSLSTPDVSSLYNNGYSEIFNISGITVNANNAEEFINSFRTLKNKAIQKASKRK